MSDSHTTAWLTQPQVRLVSAFWLTLGLVVSSSLTAVSAHQLADGRFTFDHAPRLVNATTNQLASFVSGATYEFTLTVPPDAGASLQAVTISPAATAPKIQFALNQSQAVANGRTIHIAAIGGASSNDVTIAFAHPIPPGSTVTISLLAQHEAGSVGVDLFGMTAYPVGDATNGLFLGYERVTRFSPGG